jgi:CubicO group peptidase (beta-lactamase class C family)
VIEGSVAPGFEGVRDAFERCFSELGETGAGFTALVDGRVVAELWGGHGFGRDSLVHVYSCTKPLAAFCVLVLIDRGVLGLDDTVASVWPEFAQAGKGDVTVRQLLSHQAGVVALRDAQPTELLFDWERLCAALAAEAPFWQPGTAHGEHALFYGHLCGELVRRLDGRSLGTFWRDEVSGPWRLDAYIGLSEPERLRAVDLVGEIAPGEGELYRRATSNPPGARDLSIVNGAAWRAAEIPAINGHATATALARFFAGLLAGGELDGVRLVSSTTVAAVTAGELTAVDAVFGEEITWGLGVWVDHDGYGMGGLGGSLAMADPQLGLAEAFVTRTMGEHDRSELMDAALRAALSATP